MTLVRLEPAAPRSRVKHSTTDPLGSLNNVYITFKIVTHFICMPMGSRLYITNPQLTIVTWPERKLKLFMYSFNLKYDILTPVQDNSKSNCEADP